ECKAPHGGMACVGQVPSCCDACGAGGTCPSPTSTTTSLPPLTTTTVTTSTTMASSTTSSSTTTSTAAATTTTTSASTTTTAPPPPTTTTTTAPPPPTTTTTAPPPPTTPTPAPPTPTTTNPAPPRPTPTAPPTPTTPPTTTTAPTPTTTTTTTTTTPTTTTTTTPPPPTTTTTTTAPPPTTTTTLAGCCGFSPQPGKLSFTTGIGSGNCGKLLGSAGNTLLNLSCGGLYTGGGGNSVPLPYAVPDMGQSLTKVAACTGTALNLSATTSTDVGGTHPERSCTSKGCLFGPPLPIPNPASPPTSVCVINSVATDASGTADCSSGASAVSLPLTSTLFLDGDLFPPDTAGSDHCVGGTNSGTVCTANATCTGGGFCSVGVQVCPICAGDGK